MGWTIVLDTYKGSEDSYQKQKELVLLISEALSVGASLHKLDSKYIEINYPDLLELLWDIYTEKDTILLRMGDGSLKPLPHHDENIIDKDGSVGKHLRREHNVFKIWRAGGFNNL